MFKKVAAAARLKKRDFKAPDKVPRTYDKQPFTLDGQMDLDVTFDDKTMKTPVYLKMDAHDQLLLSEGVCRQLGIISYHPEVQTWRGGRKRPPSEQTEKANSNEAKIPTVRVRLLQSVRLLPHQAVVAQVQLDNKHDGSELLLLECSMQVEEETGLQIDVLLQPTIEGQAQMVLSNPSGFTQVAEQGPELGIASPATVIQPTLGINEDLPGQPGDPAFPQTKSPGPTESEGIKRVTADTVGQRQARLMELIEEPNLPEEGKRTLSSSPTTTKHSA